MTRELKVGGPLLRLVSLPVDRPALTLVLSLTVAVVSIAILLLGLLP